MAKHRIQTKKMIRIEFEFTEQEARILRDLVQNSQDKNESEASAEVRRCVFEGLKEALQN